MIEKIKKHQRLFLIGLIVICTGIMALGAVVYLEKVEDNLKNDAIQDVMDLTMQQRQSRKCSSSRLPVKRITRPSTRSRAPAWVCLLPKIWWR